MLYEVITRRDEAGAEQDLQVVGQRTAAEHRRPQRVQQLRRAAVGQQRHGAVHDDREAVPRDVVSYNFV